MTATLRLTNGSCDSTITRYIEITSAPTAGYTTASDSVCRFSPIYFLNTSSTSASTSPMTHIWDFGDGSTDSVNTNTGHTFATAGTFVVKLTTLNSAGIARTFQKTITVLPTPTANYTSGFSCAGDSLPFTNTSTGATSYQWNFGGAGTSTATSPKFKFNTPGTFNALITLIATNTVSCTDTLRRVLQVFSKPVASFVIANHCEGLPAPIINNTSIDSGTFGSNWYFGNGKTGLSNNPVYVYDSNGTYTVKLVATSNFGCQDSTTQTVTIHDRPKAAYTIDATSKCQGDTLGLVNTTTFGAGLSNVSYVWDFGDNTATTTATNPRHAYGALTTYSLKLMATESINGCRDSLVTNVQINEHASNVGFSASTTTTCVGTSVSFTNFSQPPFGQTNSFMWEFGDAATATTTNPSHAYATVGTKKVKLTTTTSQGCHKSDSVNISVSTPPSAKFKIMQGTSVYNDTFQRTMIADVLNLPKYGWNFGDSQDTLYSFGDTATHIWNYMGWKHITLLATDANGCTGMYTDSVYIAINNGIESLSDNAYYVSVFPNPFSDVATVSYTLTRTAPVSIRVYDMLGRKVAEMDKGIQSSGSYTSEINAETFSSASAAYMVRIQIGETVITRQLIQAK